MAVVNDIRKRLRDNGLVDGSTGWTLVIDHIPSTPDKVIALFQYSGRKPEANFALRYPNFQIRARGASSDTGYDDMVAKMEAIYQDLRDIKDTAVNGSTYAYVNALGDIATLGRDKDNRPSIVQNYETAINT